MADGTIRGTFDLNTDPAVRGMRSIRTAGAEADVVVRQLGSSLDSIGGPNTQRKLDSTSGNVRDIATAAEEARVGVDELGSSLDEVGRKRATAHVEVNGLTHALADVARLEAALDRLDRRRATAHIGTSGGFGGVPAQVAQAATGGGGGGGGGFPGGAKGLLGLLGLGAVAPLGGAALGIGGSAASAATGAGVVSGAGLATVGVGLAPTVFGVKSFADEIKKAQTAQQAYNMAVAQYGAASKQAATAKQRMDAVFGENPGTRRAISELQQLRQAAQTSVTQPVRATIAMGAGQILHDVRTRALPTLAPGIRADARSTMTAATAFSNFATAPNGAVMTAAVAMQHEFARDVPIMEQSLQNIATLFSNVTRASLPYFHEANLWVQNTTQGWASWSQNTTKVNAALDHGVQSFREWRDLATATFHLVRDLFSAGRPSGDSMVGSLTTQLNTWDAWIKTNPQRVRQFFSDAERDTRRIAGAVWEIARALGQVSSLLAPILGRMAQLVSTFGAAGLLIPTALRIGAGRLAGDRFGGILGYGGRGAAAGAGAAGVAGAAGAGRLPTLVPPGAYLAPRGLGPQRLAPLATPEAFAQRYGAIPGARYAGPASVAGSRAYGLSRLRAPLARAGGAALRFGGPVLGVNALLGGIQAPGGFDMGLLGALSGATLGIVPTPFSLSPDQAQQRAMRAVLESARTGRASSFQTSSLGSQSFNLRAPFLGVTAQGRNIANPLAGRGALPGVDAVTGQFTGAGVSNAQVGQMNKAINASMQSVRGQLATASGQRRSVLAGEMQALIQLRDEYAGVGRKLNAQAVQQAQGYSQHFGDAFNLYSKRMGPVKAMNIMRHDMLDEMGKLNPAGKRVLAQNALSWMNQMQKDNPALKGQYEDLKKSIVSQFDAMGQHIAIVNGQILDGSRSEWQKISLAMSDPLELARERMQKSFTQIQLMAVGSLTAMGYKPAEARSLVRGMDPQSNKAQQKASGQAANVGPGGIISGRQNAPTGRQFAQHRARGGRLPGIGLADSVRMSDGGYGAPGELVVNRHLESDVDRDLWRAGKLTLGQRVGRETRFHSAPFAQEGAFAKGGRLGGVGAALGAIAGVAAASSGLRSQVGLGGVHPNVLAAARAIEDRFPGLTITSGTGGGHAGGSYHYRGDAVDISGGSGEMNSAAQWIKASGMYRSLVEGIHNPNLSVKNGAMVSPGFWGAATWAQHLNHIHIALTGALGALTGGAAGGMPGAQSISLHGIKSGLRGVPGALADRGSAIYARGLQGKINARLGAMAGGAITGHGGGGNATANMQLGHQMMLQAGWPESEWPSLRALWQQESGWDSNSVNRGSGAYGIPQALGHGHPFNLGDAGAQIAWGLNYIRGRYGSPSSAEAHERSAGWYATGGRLGRPSWLGWFDRGTDFTTTPGRPVMFGAGEKRRERVRIEPLSRDRGTGGGHTFQFDFSGATITSEEHAKAIGEMVVTKVIEALDRGQVPDSAVAG